MKKAIMAYLIATFLIFIGLLIRALAIILPVVFYGFVFSLFIYVVIYGYYLFTGIKLL
jgi:hypothetical protein